MCGRLINETRDSFVTSESTGDLFILYGDRENTRAVERKSDVSLCSLVLRNIKAYWN